MDASAWFPLMARGHPDHTRIAAALRQRRRAGARVLTTNLVVAETHALLVRRVHRAAALAFLRQVGLAGELVVSSTSELELRARQDWLERFADQDFSLADAVSFAVMSERGIREALTQDRHFATAGFVMVPAEATL
ncbi:MAG: PIN domain-containing protein [Gemmatimonadales bacterium]